MNINDHQCQICGKTAAETTLIPAATIRAGVMNEIQRAIPAWDKAGFICEADVVRFREKYVESLMQQEMGELSSLESAVVQSIARREIISAAPDDDESEETRTLGDRMSDGLARFGGSWNFLLSFAAMMVVWISINSVVLLFKPFDPFPFILLNLVLSCLAAIQAPIIMMSQNRLEAKDRQRAQKDYQVNLKAELEIRAVHEKIDHLLTHQWQRMAELQSLQIELLQELKSLQKPLGKG
jgi:uncharacterized membrane protein